MGWRTRGGLQVCDRAQDDGESLSAAGNLAASLKSQGKDEAEKMEREVLAVMQRVLVAEHPHTLTAAGNMAATLSRQGKHDEAVAMEREVLVVSACAGSIFPGSDPFSQWEWIHFPVGVEWIRFLIFIFPGKIDLPLHSRSAPMNKAWGNAALPRMAVDPCGKLPQGLGFRV